MGADEFFFMKPFYSRNRVPQFLKRVGRCDTQIHMECPHAVVWSRVGPIRFPWRGSALLSAASRSLARRQRLRITRDPRLRLCRAEFEDIKQISQRRQQQDRTETQCNHQ